MSNDGWIGTYREVLSYLDVVGADRDAEGRPIVTRGVSLFLLIEDENNDAVIDGEAQYFVGGKPCNLAAGLRSTSYGLAVKVY